MKIIRQPEQADTVGRPVAIAIGFFDGVHTGHQRVIGGMVESAHSNGEVAMVVTFDRHPSSLVAPDRTPPLIHTLDQRLRSIEQLKPDACWLIEFTRPFSLQTGEVFTRALAAQFPPLRQVFVGDRFHFGFKRSGNVELLRQLAPECGFAVHALPPVMLDGEPVSSTRIRDRIKAGDFSAANRLLGRAYAFSGRVVRGRELGRRLGFPTANLDTTGLVVPPTGVYAGRASAGSAQHDAVLNIGHRPTVDGSGALSVEVHLLNFAGDLYGQELEVTPIVRLRDEQRFSGIDELTARIRADVARARDLLAPITPG